MGNEWLLTEKEMVKAKKVDTSYWHAKDEAIAKAQAKKLVEWLDWQNTLKLKSLKGTPDEFKHCGLLIPIEPWQALRKAVLEGK